MKIKLIGGNADGRKYDLKHLTKFIEIPVSCKDGYNVDRYEVRRIKHDPEGIHGGHYEGVFVETRTLFRGW